MGLKFPEDLDAWRQWEKKQNFLRYLKDKVKRSSEPSHSALVLARRTVESKPKVLVALEATTPTQIAALLAPAYELEKSGYEVAVLAQKKDQRYLLDAGFNHVSDFSSAEDLVSGFDHVSQVIAAGNYLAVGEWVYQQSQKQGWDFNVVQHGLNTPFVPPLPQNSYLFSFSEKDSEFWISGRTDIKAYAVGSQLFFEAMKKPQAEKAKINSAPTFLGQMHGAELARWSFALASYKFCKVHGATYRPHPSERDKLSLLTHKIWEKLGISIDRSGSPLNQSSSPVVSVFSTGVLEAAIRGVPAWVYHPNPPAWLLEFWDRYGMNQWGSAPTPAPVQPEKEPALAIAEHIAQNLLSSE